MAAPMDGLAFVAAFVVVAALLALVAAVRWMRDTPPEPPTEEG